MTIMTKLDRLRIAFGPNGDFSTGPALFDDVSITTADIGRGFVATPANDPDFPEIARQLTNGTASDYVFVVTGLRSFGAAGAKQTESYWASNNSAPADFQGAQLTAIELYINNVGFVSPGSNPNGNGIWTDFWIDRKVRFYGTVPEPATSLAMLLLCVQSSMRRR